MAGITQTSPPNRKPKLNVHNPNVLKLNVHTGMSCGTVVRNGTATIAVWASDFQLADLATNLRIVKADMESTALYYSDNTGYYYYHDY